LRTNHAETGACSEHLGEIVDAQIANSQKHGGDLDVPKFLHAAPRRRPPDLPALPYTTQDAVFESTLDQRYAVAVYRATGKPRLGVLVVRDANSVLLERTVALAYDAVFGADEGDVAEWRSIARDFVDGLVPLDERLAQACRRFEAREQRLLQLIQDQPEATPLFELALSAFADADAALTWMVQPNAACAGKTPIEKVEEPNGLRDVSTLLEQLRAWDLRRGASLR
jgi:hypothetical protein